MTRDNLRPTLLANAIFSAASGLALLIAAGTVADWLRVDGSGATWLRAVGVVLVGHAVLIAGLLPRLGVERTAALNLIAIGPYPLLLIALIVLGVIDRGLGIGLAIADALIIELMALSLLFGLRRPALQGQPQHA